MKKNLLKFSKCLIFSLLILFSLSYKVYGHNEFYKFTTDGIIPVHVPKDASLSQIIQWASYQRNSIPINVVFSSADLPSNLDLNTTNNEFTSAENIWTSASNNYIAFSSSTDPLAITIDFDTNPDKFGKSGDLDIYATCTHYADESNQWLSGYYDDSGNAINSQILFNNSVDWNNKYTWINDPNSHIYWNSSTTYIPFMSVALHELGHLLGLSHCSLDFTLMNANPPEPTLSLADGDIDNGQMHDKGKIMYYQIPPGMAGHNKTLDAYDIAILLPNRN